MSLASLKSGRYDPFLPSFVLACRMRWVIVMSHRNVERSDVIKIYSNRTVVSMNSQTIANAASPQEYGDGVLIVLSSLWLITITRYPPQIQRYTHELKPQSLWLVILSRIKTPIMERTKHSGQQGGDRGGGAGQSCHWPTASPASILVGTTWTGSSS